MCVCLWNGKKENFFFVVVNKHCEKMVKQTNKNKNKKEWKKIANKQNFHLPNVADDDDDYQEKFKWKENFSKKKF